MPAIIAIVVLSALKFFEVSIFASMSWWWVIGLAIAAFVWFEFVERIFGLDAKKAHSDAEKAKQQRIKKALEKR